MRSYFSNPTALWALSIAALAAASIAWAALARSLLATRGHPAPTRQILAGLLISIPAIGIAVCLTLVGQTCGAATVGSGAALTYLLLLPSALFGTTLVDPLWRRTILPFCLAAAAMWIIMATTGHFWPLDGQFLLTLFALGTWLFKLEATAGAAPPSSPPMPERSVAVVPATHRLKLLAVALVAIALTALAAMLMMTCPPAGRIVYLVPALGALACVGPLLYAARAGADERREWAATLGYAAMAAACLVPGLAGFLQPTFGAPPLYGPDGAFLAMAAGLLLALGDEGLATNRTSRRLLLGTWGIWLIWILLSVLLMQHSVGPLQPSDPSVWDPT